MQVHCTVTWVLHPGGEAQYYLRLIQVYDINTAQLREPRSCMVPNPAVESPKTKCSSSKGRHHCNSECSSNTSTLKHPDSTSAKKPSSSKEPVLKEAAYSAIMWDRVPDNEHKATTHHLCSEADVTWKEMHQVMYSHQLHYDRQLATFLVDAKAALNNM